MDGALPRPGAAGTPNWSNRTLFIADNLRVLRGMDSNTVDLIATDPPFNTKRQFNAPLGSKAAKARFDDRWRWDDVAGEWSDLLGMQSPAIRELIEAAAVIEGGAVDRETGEIDTGRVKNSMAAFLCWMAPRVVEMHRVLKPTGSLYLHCDPAANSYLRLLLDAVFGRLQFRNEIVWCYPPKGRAPRLGFHRKHDSLLYYGKSSEGVFHHQYTPLDDRAKGKFSKISTDGRRYKEFKGRRTYLDSSKGRPVPSWWIDIGQTAQSKIEFIGWPTQKPLALYHRIIEASSNPGDIVLDPFAGCATTCIAAETAASGQRRWIGIDIDPVAEEVTRDRLRRETGLFDTDGDPVTLRKHPPKRADIAVMGAAEMRQHLHRNQGGRCANWHCDSKELRVQDFELDHVIPKTRGGDDGIANRIGLCGNCNRRKGKTAWGAFMGAEGARASSKAARRMRMPS